MRQRSFLSALPLLALLLAALLAAAAQAQAPLVCSAQNLGQRVCQAEGICECTLFTGGTMMRDPPGYRWDCALTRGTCLGSAEMPLLSRAMLPPPPSVFTTTSSRTVVTETSRVTVRQAQSALARRGFDPGAADGVLGPRTRSALAAFQRAQRLPATGTLDAMTLSRLRSG